MSIDQTNVIDFISTDRQTGNVILTISDHWDWSDSNNHIFQLQEKINNYIRFIESGEIYEAYPTAKAKELTIQIINQYEIPLIATEFIKSLESILKTIGIKLITKLLKDS